MINPVLNIAPPAAQNASPKPSDAKSPDGFSAVLARQMEEKTAARTASHTKTPDSKASKTEKTTTASKQDKPTQQAPETPDASTSPLARLINQGFKTGAKTTGLDVNSSQTLPDQIPAPDAAVMALAVLPQAATSDAKTTGVDVNSSQTLPDQIQTPDAAAMAQAAMGQAATSGAAVSTTAHAKNSAQARQTDAVSSREKLDPAAGSSIKAESVITAQAGLKTGAETFKLAELAASLPAPPTQVLAQSVGALVASSQQPNIAPNSNTTISAPLGSNAWPAEFSQKITWVSTQQNQVAELHLNPPDLGPMSVTISVADNQATALFSSPHSAVREAIENALPKLRESLAENGIMLGNATVSDQAPRDSGAGNFMNQRSNSRADTETSDNMPATTSAILPAIPASRHNGMVDTFA